MKKKTSPLIGRIACITLFLVCFTALVKAQVPAANITGPLHATINGGNITLTSEIAFGGDNPTLTYTIVNNTSGASVVGHGRYVVNAASHKGTQSVTVNPGNTAGAFVVRLEITTPKGTTSCSQSVAVSNE